MGEAAAITHCSRVVVGGGGVWDFVGGTGTYLTFVSCLDKIVKWPCSVSVNRGDLV